ncbi:hypothetical protein [Roseateles oligotrophus]|uniref:Uncharacterized protein n=1 Tax=Roseateles oligotrophus TaxID=1769250 RepID=A0ABT2YJJ1_9BURK|nr:hypothetical protein [Roseateles oligotrophus]MCV2370236.1 hypothetical protein [Roseateles oligotrophus]
MPSQNLHEPFAWWMPHAQGQPRGPYDLLPRVFADLSTEQQAEMDDGTQTGLQDGGAAMAAYARLQQEDLLPATRAAIEQALLRYCELDTLAMVMTVQAWRNS